MLKRFLTIGPALGLLGYGLWVGPRYDRFVLPAFDGYVYDAMADTPEVFTLAPWGYRILGPWIVHMLGASSAAAGYFWLTLASLTASLVGLGIWLRRLGYGDGAAALAGAVFAISPPVREFIDYQVLVSPLGVLILTLTLVELTAPRTLVMAALFAAGALTREECLLPIAILLILKVREAGMLRGTLATLQTAAPALVLWVGLRATWGSGRPVVDKSLLWIVVERVQQSAFVLMSTAVLGGVFIFALVGLFRETSLFLRIQGVLLWFLTFALAFCNPYHFSAADLPRLSASAWPAILPLALSGAGFRRGSVRERKPDLSKLATALSLTTLAICVVLVLKTDPYRRAPVDGSADPIPYLARSRETLKTARTLDEGGTFVFDSRSGRFALPVTERFNLTDGRRQRFFLYAGFGREATFGPGAPEFVSNAELLLSVLEPRDAFMTMDLQSESPVDVTVEVAGLVLPILRTNNGPVKVTVPRATLFRGDNVVHFSGPDGVAIRLVRWEISLDPRRSGS